MGIKLVMNSLYQYCGKDLELGELHLYITDSNDETAFDIQEI